MLLKIRRVCARVYMGMIFERNSTARQTIIYYPKVMFYRNIGARRSAKELFTYSSEEKIA